MIRISRTIMAATLAALSATATPFGAGAQEPAKRKVSDPNEVVCKREEVTGSRLQSRRVCMTRAQWAEQRQLDRANVERSQTAGCQRQGGC